MNLFINSLKNTTALNLQSTQSFSADEPANPSSSPTCRGAVLKNEAGTCRGVVRKNEVGFCHVSNKYLTSLNQASLIYSFSPAAAKLKTKPGQSKSFLIPTVNYQIPNYIITTVFFIIHS